MSRLFASAWLVLFSVTLAFTGNESFAQCSGGGAGSGGGASVRGSGAGAVRGAGNSLRLAGLSSPGRNLGSPNSFFASPYSQQMMQAQSLAFANAFQNGARQRMQMAAYQQRMQPIRLARARAKRQELDDRIAARQSGQRSPTSRRETNYAYTSLRSKEGSEVRQTMVD